MKRWEGFSYTLDKTTSNQCTRLPILCLFASPKMWNSRVEIGGQVNPLIIGCPLYSVVLHLLHGVPTHAWGMVMKPLNQFCHCHDHGGLKDPCNAYFRPLIMDGHATNGGMFPWLCFLAWHIDWYDTASWAKSTNLGWCRPIPLSSPLSPCHSPCL